jgi:hypothetical protein
MTATLEQVEYLATHIANLKAMENEAAIERHKAEAELAGMICIRDEGTETRLWFPPDRCVAPSDVPVDKRKAVT